MITKAPTISLRPKGRVIVKLITQKCGNVQICATQKAPQKKHIYSTYSLAWSCEMTEGV